MKNIFLSILVFTIALQSCDPEEVPEDRRRINSEPVTSGMWLGQIALSDSVNLPFVFEWKNGEIPLMILHNAQEKIIITEITQVADSIHLNFPVFNTSLHFKFTANSMSGTYVKNDAVDYKLAFNAEKTDNPQRYTANADACCNIDKQWAVTFRPQSKKPGLAIAEIAQEGQNISGTFLTETGDYRFLNGTLNGDQFQIAGFDGSSLYVFKATVSEEKLEGTFFSGKSRADHWVAKRDSTFKLRDPETLTYLNKGYISIEFTLPLTPDTSLVFNAENFAGQVTILQILGSWCPNCMDESRFLEKIYEYYKDDGLNVIGLAFERKNDQALGFKAIEKMGTDLELRYPIGFAGSTSPEDRAKFLPQINAITAFPTTIFIDKKGVVRKIHTGFSGPSTAAYTDFKFDTYEFIQMLLME